MGAWREPMARRYTDRAFEDDGDSSVALRATKEGLRDAFRLEQRHDHLTLRSGGVTLGTVSNVELLGGGETLTFVQDGQGLTVTPSGSVQPLSGITDQGLASATRVLRITHDKGWVNDDDPGTRAPGWLRVPTWAL
jgi:hypothetical protein